MKILFCHNRYQVRGGEDVVVDQEIDLLRSSGTEVLLHEVTNTDIAGFFSKVKTSLSTPYSFPAKARLKEKLRTFNPDVVHVHNFFPLLTPSIYDACIEERVPVVQTLHNYRLICANGLFLRQGKACEVCLQRGALPGFAYGCYRNSRLATAPVSAMIALHHALNTWNKKVDQFIVPTEFGKKMFVEFGINAKKITVKPNFTEDHRSKNLQKSNEQYAIYVGRLSEEKGLRTLLGAWKSISVPLVIVGDGPMEQELRSSAPPQVRFLGRLSHGEAMEKLAGASALVFPTECYEGAFPLTLMEAMSLEVPIVASDIGTIPEFLTDNSTAALFRSGDASHLSAVFQSLIGNKEKMNQFRSLARSAYEKHFTPKSSLESLLKIYESAQTAPQT